MQHVDFVVRSMLGYTQDHGLLTHYQDDLVKHDRALLEKMDGWRAFGWVVSPTSSDVYPIGLHEKFNEDISYIANLRVPSGAHCLWVNPERAKHDGSDVLVPVTLEAFKKGIRTSSCYQYKEGFILTPTGAKVAQLSWESTYCWRSGTHTCLYEMNGLIPSFSRAWGEQFALREVVKRHGVWTRLYNKQEYLEYEKAKAAA